MPTICIMERLYYGGIQYSSRILIKFHSLIIIWNVEKSVENQWLLFIQSAVTQALHKFSSIKVVNCWNCCWPFEYWRLFVVAISRNSDVVALTTTRSTFRVLFSYVRSYKNYVYPFLYVTLRLSNVKDSSWIFTYRPIWCWTLSYFNWLKDWLKDIRKSFKK